MTAEFKIQTVDAATQKWVMRAIWIYNQHLNKDLQLDQMFDHCDDPLRNFLHTKTIGNLASIQDFFVDLAAYADQIDAKVQGDDDWDIDLVYDATRSEVAHALGIESKQSTDESKSTEPPAAKRFKTD